MPCQDYRNHLQRLIDEGISQIAPVDDDPSVIAQLCYTDQENNEKELTISLVGHESVAQGGQAGETRKYPKIQISFKNNRHIDLIARWSLACTGNNETNISNISVMFRQLRMSWEFITCEREEDADNGTPEYSTSARGRKLPGFRSLTDVSTDFLRFWFSDNNNKNDATPPITRQKELYGEYFRDTWSLLKLDNRDFNIDLPADLVLQPGYIDQVEDTTKENLAKLVVVLFCWRFLLMFCARRRSIQDFNRLIAGVTEDDLDAFYKCIPDPRKDYRPRRPVDIDPHGLWQAIALTDQNDESNLVSRLAIPWHVIAAATASLNAGKHVIFTGAPGCGKTTLAKKIAEFATNKPPLMSTASQAWTTDELIGRYLPTINGKGLEFRDGYFLQALQNGQWLIIDEMNRCDIDNCFGELFTVLANESVVLPFERVPSGEEGDDPQPLPIKIAVGDLDEENEPDQYYTIPFPSSFRIIATMNDADISGLNNLGFALRRRFAIIRVDSPSRNNRKNLFNKYIDYIFDSKGLRNRLFTITNNDIQNEYFTDNVKSKTDKLFASDNNDLISLGIVGISPAINIIEFIGEGLRSPLTENNQRRLKRENNQPRVTYARSWLISSYLAMAIVLNVYPQLDAALGEIEDRFLPSIECILTSFGEEEKFLRIEKGNDGLTLVDTGMTIRKYLFKELIKQYATDNLLKETIKNKIKDENLLDDGELTPQH